MKILHRDDSGLCIGILDDDNYTVFHENTRKESTDKKTGKVSVGYKFSYYPTMHGAILELSRRLANDSSNDIPSWIKSLTDTSRALQSACLGQ